MHSYGEYSAGCKVYVVNVKCIYLSAVERKYSAVKYICTVQCVKCIVV